jgi:hypothetical protein
VSCCNFVFHCVCGVVASFCGDLLNLGLNTRSDFLFGWSIININALFRIDIDVAYAVFRELGNLVVSPEADFIS